MVIEHFLKWIETANVTERVAAADALARAYLNLELAFEDRCAAEAGLTLLLDDPSPKVRGALSEALSVSPMAPPHVVATLAQDQPEIAGFVIARSPLLNDADLIDRAATAPCAVQKLIADRPGVSRALAAAIGEVAEPEAVVALLRNRSADIAAITFQRVAERLGHVASIRSALMERPDLGADVRHVIMRKASDALRASPLVQALMGQARAERITREACHGAAVGLIDSAPADEYPALVEHLRLSGDLTIGLVLRVVAHGKIDFFAAILEMLGRQKAARVAALLANGRDSALSALFGAAGLPANTHEPLLAALRTWRDVASGRLVAGAQEVSWTMLRTIPGVASPEGPAERDREIAGLIKSIHMEQLRRNARGHARAIAAA